MSKIDLNSNLLEEQRLEIIAILRKRFMENPHRHVDLDWVDVEKRLDQYPEKLWSLLEMDRTGGEPDVISIDSDEDKIYFFDCSKESPELRRNTCYDGVAREQRKEHKPTQSAMEMAEEMGIQLLNEEQYRRLQQFGEFDLKTSSWIKTPDEIRMLGGALFCDRRYDHVFVYHNGAQSYYSNRGFRGYLEV